MPYPLDTRKKFDNTQQAHFDAALKLAQGRDEYKWALLEGGPGTGKTFLTSNIQLWLMENLGAEILTVYPTHAARLVGIGELIENSKVDGVGDPQATVKPYDEDEPPSQQSDVILNYKNGSIKFQTIHAALKIQMARQPGKDSRFEQTFSNAVKAQPNFRYDFIFMDEISMISEEMISKQFAGLEDNETIKAGIIAQIDALQNKLPNFNPLVHLTGDFNQLQPPEGKFAEKILREDDDFLVKTALIENHRAAESQGIVHLIDYILEHGDLPKFPDKLNNYAGVHHMTDKHRYFKKFKQEVARRGSAILGLSHSNEVRMIHSNLAAEAKKQTHQFFVGNRLTVAEGKGIKIYPEPSYGPKHEIYFYNSEQVEIIEAHGEVLVPGTQWAGDFAIPAHEVVLNRVMTGERYPRDFTQEPQFYLVDFLGDKKKNCPKFRYLNYIKSTLNKHLKSLVKNEEAREKTGDAMHTVGQSPSFLIQYLYKVNSELGAMVEFLCYTLDKKHVVKRYLENANNPTMFSILFDRMDAGTPNSLFNFLWATMYENINFKVLTTRSENAMTCHNAQGSGRECVFLNSRDINSSKEKKRLLYVGVSRAKKSLVILT